MAWHPLINIGPIVPPPLFVYVDDAPIITYKVGAKGRTIPATIAEVIALAAKRG